MSVQVDDNFLQMFSYFSKIVWVFCCATLVSDVLHNLVAEKILQDVVTVRNCRRLGTRILGSELDHSLDLRLGMVFAANSFAMYFWINTLLNRLFYTALFVGHATSCSEEA
jgi:hypothetical protein